MLSEFVSAYKDGVTSAIEKLPMKDFEKAVWRLEEARQKGQRIFTCGNGGSAATSAHFAADLQKGATVPGKPLFDTECLCDNLSRFSAWANDSSYADVFVETMRAKIKKGSVLIALSGSGNSPNIINALTVANSLGASTIGLTGFNGGRMKDVADICIVVSSKSIEQIEDVHLLLCHLFTFCLRSMSEISTNQLPQTKLLASI